MLKFSATYPRLGEERNSMKTSKFAAAWCLLLTEALSTRRAKPYSLSARPTSSIADFKASSICRGSALQLGV